jgi:hypothetical protein
MREARMPTDDSTKRLARNSRLALAAALAAPLVACGSDDNGSPTGGNDASVMDSGGGHEAGNEAAAADSPSGGDAPGVDAPGDDGGMGGDSGTGGDASEGGSAEPTHVVIADQYNNRVVEIDPAGNIVWTFGDGSQVPGPTSVVGPNDSERLPNGQTLIAGTGIPGPMAGCTLDAGCPDNRVLLVDKDGGIVWQYGDDGGLNVPVCSVMLKSGNVLITDQANQRVIEVTPQKTVAWTYAPTAPDGGFALNSPNSAERLDNGDTLITDENNNRVLEVAPDGGTVWQYPTTPDAGLLSGAAFASRLPSGNTLITDANNARILEVTSAGAVVWTYYTASRSLSATAPVVDGGNPAPVPTRAVRLASGNTLISDQLNHQVIEIDPVGNVVFSYGQLNVAGSAPGQLNGPYDAKRVGDFTGLTPPQ